MLKQPVTKITWNPTIKRCIYQVKAGTMAQVIANRQRTIPSC